MTNLKIKNIHNDNDQALIDAINTDVPRELISSRSGGGSITYAYLKGDVIADQMNKIFGPLAWDVQAESPEVTSFTDVKNVKRKNGKYEEANVRVIVVTTTVRLRIKARNSETTDTLFIQTGVGTGEYEEGRPPKEAVGMAVKGAETDGLKRCASLIGRAFGLYMNGAGEQSDIAYAHVNNNDGLRKAKMIVNEKNSQNNHQPNHKENRQEKAPVNKKQEPAKNTSKTSSNNHQKTEQESPEKENKTENQGNVKNTGRKVRQAKTDFDLETMPITRDDQINYGATIVEELKTIANQEEKEKLVAKHHDTICNLEVGIKNRVIKILEEHNIDINKIQK